MLQRPPRGLEKECFQVRSKGPQNKQEEFGTWLQLLICLYQYFPQVRVVARRNPALARQTIIYNYRLQ